MNIPKTIEECKYNAQNWWNKSINPEATIQNALPNCTCLIFGCFDTNEKPVSVITNANEWHNHLINGWYAMPYEEYKNNIKVGDVLEWTNGNHVAIVSDVSDGNNDKGSSCTYN